MFFFFNDTATTEIYTLSLHDALPIFEERLAAQGMTAEDSIRTEHQRQAAGQVSVANAITSLRRSEEHTSELQSRLHLVCRLLLEKKKHFLAADETPTNSRDNGVDKQSHLHLSRSHH